ncbi:MAG: hypothetical protein JSW34_09815 [Candidatus Zixiibacteriota bacterium]|nr:MAG: hypothetical protein JSW34_09815 [candidate division Zixibacteria bacterium]
MLRRTVVRFFTVVLIVAVTAAVAVAAPAQPASKTFRLDGERSLPDAGSRDMTAVISTASDATESASFEISLWQGECRFVVDLRRDQAPSEGPSSITGFQVTDDTVLIPGRKVQHRLFKTPGGMEWEMTLLDHPGSNLIDFDIQTDGLVFFYQDTLSTFARDSLGAVRPDSVIGAYVAYHAGKAHDRLVIHRGDTTRHSYGTGQAFVIYRPRAWYDGDTVWCDLRLDMRDGILSVALDANWLRSARFPVTIDPTFGNTAIGASSMNWNQLYAYCHYLTGTNTYTVPAGKTATVTRYSVYGSETGAGDIDIQMAAFAMSGGFPEARVDQPVTITVAGGTPGWFHSGSVSHSLRAQEEYGVAVGCAPRSGGTVYYNDVAYSTATDRTNCTLGSTGWTQETETSFNFSMYATYTEQEGPSVASARRRMLTER